MIISRQLHALLMLFALSACSTYPSKFKCADSRGLGCTMLSNVDKQIDSGEIQEVYLTKPKCRGKNCPLSDKEVLARQPKLRSQDQQIVKFVNSNEFEQ